MEMLVLLNISMRKGIKRKTSSGVHMVATLAHSKIFPLKIYHQKASMLPILLIPIMIKIQNQFSSNLMRLFRQLR